MERVSFHFGKKNIPAFLIAVVIIIYGMVSSFDGLKYFFSQSDPKVLGDAMELDAKVLSEIKDGDFVEVKGITSVHGGTLKKGLLSEKYILFYLAGSSKLIIIEKSNEEILKAGPQFRTIQGRAHSFKTNSQAAKMRDFFSKSFLINMDENGFLIESGNVPGESYGSLILFAGMVILMTLTIVLFIKSLNQNKETAENDSDDI